MQLLERSRGVLLREGLDGRRELELLRNADPALAEEFELLRNLLDASDLAGMDLYGSGAGTAPPRDGRTRHLAVVARWDALLDRIRERPGLETFLRPEEIGPWTSSPVDEPIVIVTASPYRCDALLVVGDEPVRNLELDCDYDDLAGRAAAFRMPRRTDDRMLDDLAWLWDHVTGPVLAELGLRPSRDPGRDDLPAIRWCPVGVASFLPLHAAGHHDRTGTGKGPAVMDHAVSSYTPTIGALRSGAVSEGGAPAPRTGEDVLVVDMSTTPGEAALPGARAEVAHITGILQGATVLAGPDATRAAVVEALATHRFAHFACHATADPAAPARSRLVLHDHRSAPLTVADLAALSLPDAGLAYLSACSTATSNEQLADESVHIATAFRIAGFPRVVGTLWPVGDTAARRIAQGFYTELASVPGAGHAARALHRAVHSVRSEQPTAPSLWAAHVLVG